MKCSNCGQEIPDNLLFCQFCGTAVKNDAAPTQATCPQCAAENEPGAAFCRSCGSKLQAAGPVASAEPAAPAAPIAQAAPVVPAKASGPRKKGLFIALAILLVVLLAGGGVYALFGRDIKRMVLGPKASYLAIESQTLKNGSAALTAELAKAGDPEQMPEKGGAICDIQFDLDEEMLGIDSATATALENITLRSTLNFDRSSDQPKFFETIDLLSGGEVKLTLEALMDQEQIILGMPDILDKAIVATYAELTQYTGMSGLDSTQSGSSFNEMFSLFSGDLGIDEESLNASLDKIIDIMLKHVDKVEFSAGQNLTAAGVSAKYDLYTVTIGKESASQMVIEICQLLKEDDGIYNLVSKMVPAGALSGEAGSGEPLSREDYEAELDQVIDQVESGDSEDFTLIQKTYVDKNDQIRGRELTVENADGDEQGTILIAQTTDGSKEGLVVKVDAEESAFEFTSAYTVKDGKMTGSATMADSGSEILTVDFEDIVVKQAGYSSRLLGKITINFENTGDIENSFALPVTSLVFTGSEEDGKYVVEIDIPNLLDITVNLSEIDAKDVEIPEYKPENLVSVSDQEALAQLLTPEVQEKLMTILGEMGLMSAIQ